MRTHARASSRRDVLEHLAALHDECHTLESADVRERIAVDGNQIGLKPRAIMPIASFIPRASAASDVAPMIASIAG